MPGAHRVGGGVVGPAVLPHHRAYGRVHGGSSSPIQLLVHLEETQESPFLGSPSAAPPPSVPRVVVRRYPWSPWPFDARSSSTGGFRPPYPVGARTSQSYFLRLLWSSRLRHRSRVACSGLGLLRQPSMPSADFCLPRATPSGEVLPSMARAQISQGKARDLRPNPVASTRSRSG